MNYFLKGTLQHH